MRRADKILAFMLAGVFAASLTGCQEPAVVPVTEVSKKTVEVRDAYSGKVDLPEFPGRECHIPEVIISDTDTMPVNSAIYSEYKYMTELYAKNDPNDFEFYESWGDSTGLDYDYYIADDFVSLCVYGYCFSRPEDLGCYSLDRKIYNVSVETGHQLSKNEMLSMLNMTESGFHDLVRESIAEGWPTVVSDLMLNDADTLKTCYESNISDKCVEKAQPFVDSKGIIRFVCTIVVPAGSGDMLFSAPIGIYTGKPEDRTTDDTTAVSVQEPEDLYRDYMRDVLIPELGLIRLDRETFNVIPDLANNTLSYTPAEDYIDASGILSADVDDYNGDGTDDLIVIYLRKESAEGLDLIYTNSDSIYRTCIRVFTTRDGVVTMTDDYTALGYEAVTSGSSLICSLMNQEMDNKKCEIIKCTGSGDPMLQIYSQVSSGPAFRYEQEVTWPMAVDKDGKLYMTSYYTSSGSGTNYDASVYELSGGKETRHNDYSTDNTLPVLLDFLKPLGVEYDTDKFEIVKNDHQILLGSFSFDVAFTGSATDKYDMTLKFTDGGALSSSMR